MKFNRVINPARVPATDDRGKPVSVRLWVCINYDGTRLSLTGVEGPKSNGDAYGSAGQCGVDAEATPTEGYTVEMLNRLRDVWDRWHLNDMRSYSPEMKAAGWDVLARKPMIGYEFSRTLAAYQATEAAKDAALAAAKAGQTFTPTPAQVAALNQPYGVTLWVAEGEPEPAAPAGMERAQRIDGGGLKYAERKTLGWLRPDEHPDGLLTRKLHPEDADGYGCKWWLESVPADVLEWLAALPLPPDGIKPAWT